MEWKTAYDGLVANENMEALKGRDKEDICIKARRAVVLCTDGFDHRASMGYDI